MGKSYEKAWKSYVSHLLLSPGIENGWESENMRNSDIFVRFIHNSDIYDFPGPEVKVSYDSGAYTALMPGPLTVAMIRRKLIEMMEQERGQV